MTEGIGAAATTASKTTTTRTRASTSQFKTHKIKYSNYKIQTFLFLFSIFPESIIETLLQPLLPFISRSLLPSISSQNMNGSIDSESLSSSNLLVGARSGALVSAFYLPLLLTNIFWGHLSDHPKVGVRPILILGLFVCAVSAITLGFTESYSTALACRFVAGVFGGNSTVTKGALGLVLGDESEHDDEQGDCDRDDDNDDDDHLNDAQGVKIIKAHLEKRKAWGYSMYGALYGNPEFQNLHIIASFKNYLY